MAHPLAAQVTALNTNLPSHLLQNLLITSQAIIVENTALPIASIDLAKIGHSSKKKRSIS